MTTPALTYTRPTVPLSEKLQHRRMANRAPALAHGWMVAQFALENKRLLDMIHTLREQRGIAPIKTDQGFNETWDAIEVNIQTNQLYRALVSLLDENARLFAEVNQHRRVLGQEPIKTKQPELPRKFTK